MMRDMTDTDEFEAYTVPPELVETGRIRVQTSAIEVVNRLKEKKQRSEETDF